MKNKVLYIVSSAIVLTGIYFISNSLSIQQIDKLTDIAISNVEALALDETDTQHYWCCGTSGDCVVGPNYTIKGKLSSSPCK